MPRTIPSPKGSLFIQIFCVEPSRFLVLAVDLEKAEIIETILFVKKRIGSFIEYIEQLEVFLHQVWLEEIPLRTWRYSRQKVSAMYLSYISNLSNTFEPMHHSLGMLILVNRRFSEKDCSRTVVACSVCWNLNVWSWTNQYGVTFTKAVLVFSELQLKILQTRAFICYTHQGLSGLRNSKHYASRFDLLFEFMGANVGATELASIALSAQTQQEFEISDSHIQRFFELLQRNANNVEALKALNFACSKNGRIVRSRQNMICRFLLDDQTGYLAKPVLRPKVRQDVGKAFTIEIDFMLERKRGCRTFGEIWRD